MELGTFGAVMGFATQVVRQTAEFHATGSDLAKRTELKAMLQSLAEGGRRDQATMEQTRRENVTEMILEPIAGLTREEYEVTLKPLERGADAEIRETAALLEERDRRFFGHASAKVPLPEVARTFRKIAQRKEKNVLRLRALVDPETIQ